MAITRDRGPEGALRAGTGRSGKVCAGVIALVAWHMALSPALAQNRVQTTPAPMIVPPLTSVPGQNIGPPAPRQNLSPTPPPVTRPMEGDSTTRIQNDYRTRMPAPPMPNQ